jgi:acyl-CoA reductase-like NAD-dependent aldehyde dehydrogenase
VCGGTVVWKPSVHAPTTAYLLVRCMMDAGLAPGVVNVVNGRGRGECGRAMLAGIARGLFQKVCFSGSQTAGRVVAEQAGRALVPVSLELGGRSPMLVMPDADLGRAVAEALRAAFRGAGQGRAALGNILVHRDVALPFREAFLAGVQALTSGNPVTDPEVACGPMINPRCARVFIDHFSRGREDGARLLCGGDAWSEDNRTPQVRGAIAKGSYMQPCVWDEVTPEMEIFRAELPGPTVNLSPVDSFDQALAWANACPHAAVATLLSGSAGWIARFRRDCNAAALRVNAGEDGWSGSGDSERSPGWETGYTRWQEASGAPLPEPAAGPGMERGAYEATNWDGLEGGARQLQ